MDESLRDIYNKFGENHLKFDPRKDELKLITDIGTGLLFLGIFSFIITAPPASRGCRTWIAVLGIALLICEFSFAISEVQLPSWILPATMTEYELMFYLHSLFPIIGAILVIFSQFYFVDIDKISMTVLYDVINHQKVIELPTHKLLFTTKLCII
jgi:hypothetical protein